jgi:hypothetical protein
MNRQWRELITPNNTLLINDEYRYKFPHFVSNGYLFVTHIYLKSPTECTTNIKLCNDNKVISTTQLEQNYKCGVSKIKRICVDELLDLDHLYYLCIYFPSKNDVWELCTDFSYEQYIESIKEPIEDFIEEKTNQTRLNKAEPKLNKDVVVKDKLCFAQLTNSSTTYKKKPIPKTLKCKVWDTYIGKEKGIGNCFVCNCEIDSKHFECGHIIAESRGGMTLLTNLRPVCELCNKSIGNKNMLDFKKEYFNF